MRTAEPTRVGCGRKDNLSCSLDHCRRRHCHNTGTNECVSKGRRAILPSMTFQLELLESRSKSVGVVGGGGGGGGGGLST